MSYLKPPWFTAKIFNPIAMATGIADTETLTVTKRGSKEPQKIPVLTVDVDGTKYLVSTRGESQWVKNVRAHPDITISNKSGTTGYVAQEIPGRTASPSWPPTARRPARPSRVTSGNCPTRPTTRCSR